ncbi:UDP-glycosyltransferase 91C1 [Sesamum alatum]|uniref:UDP-glycosyltransferase 91C1 n=1 Tax=Sesamum alatum TaxID=300844 RepID=A0AAE1YSJ3_9LAMI|nr:UDP-glycosyltransferase 91C1 [Sesamum alatum]
MEEQDKVLHIVMFPWLAIGHLRPFLRLSICLARKGHRISFVATPRNLQRAVQVPQDLSHLINVVAFPLPEVEHLPPHAESSMDVPHVKQQLLKVAFDLLRPSVCAFLDNVRPDWIVYDYASHWLPQLAEEMGISRAFFSLFTAAFMAFLGPPAALMDQKYSRSTAEDFTVVPEWIPFPSDMAFRLHEMYKNMEKDADGNEYDSGTSDSIRFGLSIDGSDIVIFRSCVEFEPEWFDLVRQLYQKPVIPVGVLPVEDGDEEHDSDEEWLKIKQWLDAKKDDSLVYVALGTEAALSLTEAHELALGLEQCGFPFFWVLNRNSLSEMLPDGFCDRIANRGMVYTKWAPQIKILSHPAVGAFLTHCGWNSATEALGFGRVLILFPVMNDQGLNARLLQEKKVGVEIPRNEKDGSFTRDSVAETVRLALVSEEGRKVRENARKMKELFGDKSRSSSYVDSLVHHMVQTRTR